MAGGRGPISCIKLYIFVVAVGAPAVGHGRASAHGSLHGLWSVLQAKCRHTAISFWGNFVDEDHCLLWVSVGKGQWTMSTNWMLFLLGGGNFDNISWH